MYDDNGEWVGPFLRTEFNYDMQAASAASGLACADDSLAVQGSKEETDINTIVRRFGLTGELPGDYQPPMSGDFVDVVDYQTAMNAVLAADRAFYEMPADLRTRFDNNPQKLMTFLDDPGNADEARKLGLLKPLPVAVEPVQVRVVPEAPGNSST